MTQTPFFQNNKVRNQTSAIMASLQRLYTGDQFHFCKQTLKPLYYFGSWSSVPVGSACKERVKEFSSEVDQHLIWVQMMMEVLGFIPLTMF
jgi:hypothetical protein